QAGAGRSAPTDPRNRTPLRISTPNSPRSMRAKAPAATPAGGSRAEARPKTSPQPPPLVLETAREVRVTRSWSLETPGLGEAGIDRLRPHDLFPVGVVAVGDPQDDRGAERLAAAHAT